MFLGHSIFSESCFSERNLYHGATIAPIYKFIMKLSPYTRPIQSIGNPDKFEFLDVFTVVYAPITFEVSIPRKLITTVKGNT